MKKIALLSLIGLLILAGGCASVPSSPQKGLGQTLKEVFWPDFVPIPPPQAGLVLPVHQSPAVWAECWVFEGGISERKLIIPHPSIRGKLIFAKTALKHFVINPPVSQPYKGNVLSSAITVPLLLKVYPAPYTLFILYQNFRGHVVRIQTKQFRTTGYAFNDHYISGGRKVYADKIIRLPRVNPYEDRQFRFHRTFYPGHAIKDALGLP